jgi:hypothetical protein
LFIILGAIIQTQFIADDGKKEPVKKVAIGEALCIEAILEIYVNNALSNPRRLFDQPGKQGTLADLARATNCESNPNISDPSYQFSSLGIGNTFDIEW